MDSATHRRARLLLVVVVLSGAASLMYQLAWTRRLVTVTSATATSQALVLAIFMAGLGGGALLGGRWAMLLRRPILGYVGAELLAAILAVGSMAFVGWTESIRQSMGLLPQLIAVSGYFLAITTLLGMSLPFIIEDALADNDRPDRRGRIVSALYGLNTLGAAAGCLLAGFVTIEHLGLSTTVLLGALLTGCAGLLALWGSRARNVEAPDPTAPVIRTEPRWLVAAFVSGAAGLGAEVVWTRLLGLIVPSTVYALTQVLFCVLVGIALGAGVSNAVARATGGNDLRAVAARTSGLLAALGAVILALVPFVILAIAPSMAAQKDLAAGRGSLLMTGLLGILMVASAAVAAIFPLLVMASKAPNGSRTFAGLYASNTAGAVVGSLGVGFLLLPMLGTRLTGLLLQGALIALAGALLFRQRSGRTIAVAALVTCVLFHFSHDVPRQIYAARLSKGDRILEFREGVEGNVMVTQDAHRRRLWIGSIWVAGTGGPHPFFGHIPGLYVDKPVRALGIALGTGQTFSAVLKHNLEHLDCVELNAGVVELSRKWFKHANGGLLDDERVTVHVDDGRAFMRRTEHKYDIIVLEPLQAWTAGTTNLYTREFYEEARRILAPGGVVAQWIPFYGQEPEEARSMVKSGLEVFPHASLWLVMRDGVVVYSDGKPKLSLADIERRVTERGIASDLFRIPARTPADLTSYLLLGPEGIRSWTRGAEVLTDDRPFLEFRAARAIGNKNKFRRTLDLVRPHFDHMGALIGGSRDEVEGAQKVRRAFFELFFVDKGDHPARVEILEQAGIAALSSPRWHSAHERELRAWSKAVAATDPEAARAIVECGNAWTRYMPGEPAPATCHGR